MQRVRDLGCIICRRDAQAHHRREGRRSQRRSPDTETIPLCPEHHDDLHRNPPAFYAEHGDEASLLEETMEMLARAERRTV